MPISVELLEATAQVTVDLMAAFGLTVEKAGEKASLLYDEVINRAEYFTESIYKNDTRHVEKSVDAVAVTLLTMAAQLIISNRKSVKMAVEDAMTAINQAMRHAREAEQQRLMQGRAMSA